jgi:hypothetical protein
MLRRCQETQGIERVAWGPAWNEAGLVVTREAGRPLRAEYATRHFRPSPRRLVCRPSGFTACDTPVPASSKCAELQVVSDRLGHSQISTTADLYTRQPGPWSGRGRADSRGPEGSKRNAS